NRGRGLSLPADDPGLAEGGRALQRRRAAADRRFLRAHGGGVPQAPGPPARRPRADRAVASSAVPLRPVARGGRRARRPPAPPPTPPARRPGAPPARAPPPPTAD